MCGDRISGSRSTQSTACYRQLFWVSLKLCLLKGRLLMLRLDVGSLKAIIP